MQRTTLPWPEYRDKANKLFKKGTKPAQIKALLGDPYWEGKPWHIKSNGKGGIARELLFNRRGRRTRANQLRSIRSTSKGIVEDSNYRNQQRIAKSQSNTLLHKQASAYPSIVEHDVALQAGGSNSHTSISDPFFKQFKDNVESKVYSKFGDKYVIDIDDVSGGARAIPRTHHNKFEPTSKQPGVTIDLGGNIDSFVKQLELDISPRNRALMIRTQALSAITPDTLESVFMIDEMVGNPIARTVGQGVNALRTSLGFEPVPLPSSEPYPVVKSAVKALNRLFDQDPVRMSALGIAPVKP